MVSSVGGPGFESCAHGFFLEPAIIKFALEQCTHKRKKRSGTLVKVIGNPTKIRGLIEHAQSCGTQGTRPVQNSSTCLSRNQG